MSAPILDWNDSCCSPLSVSLALPTVKPTLQYVACVIDWNDIANILTGQQLFGNKLASYISMQETYRPFFHSTIRPERSMHKVYHSHHPSCCCYGYFGSFSEFDFGEIVFEWRKLGNIWFFWTQKLTTTFHLKNSGLAFLNDLILLFPLPDMLVYLYNLESFNTTTTRDKYNNNIRGRRSQPCQIILMHLVWNRLIWMHEHVRRF